MQGTTALHICFGYPSFVPDHRPRYEFLAELAAAPVDQISIETAQANLDVSVLEELADKTIILGVSRSTTPMSRRPRRWPSACAARCPTSPPPSSSPPPTAA